jgi:ABC-2 type transport system permease protein
VTGFGAVFRRELLSLWVTPLAWVLVTVFLLLQGAAYYLVVRHLATAPALGIDTGPVQAYFGQSIFLLVSLLLLCPALLTAPVSPVAVVLGKFLAVFATYCLMWAPTVLYVVILRDTGAIDWGVVGTSYLGVLAIGGGYLALGVLMSALTRSQLVAFLLTVSIEFGLFILGIGEYVFDPGPLLDTCIHVSVFSQMDELSKGVLDLRRVVFDGSLIALPLFLTTRVVESWRWG